MELILDKSELKISYQWLIKKYTNKSPKENV
jgi:hypothetical protein